MLKPALLVAAAAVAVFLAGNLSDLPDGDVATQHPVLDGILAEYKATIGAEFKGYRNHCLTVYNLARARLGTALTPERDAVLATAAAFHDIALWTHDRIDYLDPSIGEMRAWAKRNRKKEKDVELISQLIYNHHKITEGTLKGMDPMVGAFRLADQSAFTFGVMPFDMLTKLRSKVHRALPNEGFHLFLTKRTIRHFADGGVLKMGPLPMFVW